MVTWILLNSSTCSYSEVQGVSARQGEREQPNQSSSFLMSKPSLYSLSSSSSLWLWDGLFQMYGIDAASGAAVSALGISPGDHVLDLCAAPGHHSLHSLFLIPLVFV